MGPLRIFNYKNGVKTSVTLDASGYATVADILDMLFLGSSEALKLLVNDAKIEDIKKTESAVEIQLEKETIFKSTEMGQYNVDKIFLPFTGDFVGNDKDPIITVFAGDAKGYFSGPLRNPNGYAKLMELKALLEAAAGPK